MALYIIPNFAMPTTAAGVAVTTGTAIKTMLQVKCGTGVLVRVVSWSISFDGSAAATPIKCELVETDVAATVTASVAADITRADPNAQDPTTSALVVGTAATGYTASAEGTITATRQMDFTRFLPPTGGIDYLFPLSRETWLNVSKFLRVRVTAPVAVNCYCGVMVEV